MLDLRQAFAEGSNNIRNWRNRYSSNEYPHKIVLNMMYRVYSMRIVWQAYVNGTLPQFSSFQDGVMAMEQIYGKTAVQKVNANLMKWISESPLSEVGGVIYANYERIAKSAEIDKKQLEEIEFSYLFHLLQDKCVLYWITLRQMGQSQTQAIASITGYMIEELKNFDYSMAKKVFQQLIVAKYMNDNYNPAL